MPCVIAVDAGTSSVRSLVVDHTTTVRVVAQRPLTQHYPRPGWVEHDPMEILAATRATLVEVAGWLEARGEQPAALGITNQRETVVAWDRHDGRPLHPAIVWQDRRTASTCEELAAAGYLPTVRARTGLVLDPYFSATKMAWILDRTDSRPAAAEGELVLGTVDTWLLWHLTGGPDGGVLATDPTNASRTALYDIRAQQWSEELGDLFRVPLPALAPVRPSCGRLGLLRASAVAPAGAPTPTPADTPPPASAAILDGVPISGIAGDQQSALFGQCCFTPGMAKVTYGTGSFTLANCGPEPPDAPDGLLLSVAWDLGGHAGAQPAVAYALEGASFNSGSAIQWLRDGLGIIEQAGEVGPLAEQVPDAGGVNVVPAFTGLGSPWWDPTARGTVLGLTRGSGRPQLARAVVEAMAYQVRGAVDAMAVATGQPLSTLRADGGAAVMDLLLQLQADQIGLPVARAASVESTALGAATLAGLAEGVWRSSEELASLWRADREYTPQADRALADAAYQAWLDALARARDWAR